MALKKISSSTSSSSKSSHSALLTSIQNCSFSLKKFIHETKGKKKVLKVMFPTLSARVKQKTL